MSGEKNCWTCGHWLIGGLCYKNGVDSDYEITAHDYVCDSWVKENAHGTITEYIAKQINENEEGE